MKAAQGWPGGSVGRKEAAAEPPWMGSRRLPPDQPGAAALGIRFFHVNTAQGSARARRAISNPAINTPVATTATIIVAKALICGLTPRRTLE